MLFQLLLRSPCEKMLHSVGCGACDVLYLNVIQLPSSPQLASMNDFQSPESRHCLETTSCRKIRGLTITAYTKELCLAIEDRKLYKCGV